MPARIAPQPTISESGMRAFEAVAGLWNLSGAERQRILGLPRSTYARWRAKPESAAFDANTLERVSHILGIYKALHILFTDDTRADTWIDRPSRTFGDRPARERLTTGLVADLALVRHHLDVARGW